VDRQPQPHRNWMSQVRWGHAAFGAALFVLSFGMMGVAIVEEKDEIQAAGEALQSIAKSIAATLVAKGRVYLSHDQALAALAEAEAALRFIEAMTLTVNGVEIREPVSRWEARVGLQRMAKAIENTK